MLTCAAVVARLLRPRVSTQLTNRSRALGHDVALLIERDHVIAVVEDQRVDQPAQVGLQILGVLQARHVVIARMHDERRLAHARRDRGFTSATSALKLANERIGVLKMPACAGIAALHARDDQRAHALVLEAVGLALGQVELEPIGSGRT